MTTNKKDIRRWLDLYMEGKTSLKEEDLLREYFRSQHVDKEFADFKAMFNQFDKGEPSFMEEELNAWLQSCQPEEYSNYSDTPSGPPQQPDHRHGTRRIVIRWMTAASIATVFFLLGFTLSQKESTSSVVSTPTSPTVLTQIKWKTDTLFSEKPMPAEPTTIVITVRDTIVLEAGYRDEPMRADLSTGQDSAAMLMSHAAMQDSNTAVPQQTMPDLTDIQAEFDMQKKRMNDFSQQYETIYPDHENLY